MRVHPRWVFGLVVACGWASAPMAMTVCQVGAVQVIVGRAPADGGLCAKAAAQTAERLSSGKGLAGGVVKASGGAGVRSDEFVISREVQSARDSDRVLLLRQELIRELAALRALETAPGADGVEFDRRRRDHLSNIDSLKRELARSS